MSLHDYDLGNQTPASYRTDHNNRNLSIVSQNASSSGITTTFANMLYADVSSSGWMRQRNTADSTFNFIWKLNSPGGFCTNAGSPSGNHIGKFVGQLVYDTNNNNYYYNTLAGTSSQATWSMVASSSAYNVTNFPKGYMQGLVPTYASAATFTITPGGCRDDSDSANISISTAYTVNIASAGAGGLSTSETESTSGAWYFCFAIRKSGDGTVNFILTNSSSGPVLPSGYDQKRRLPFAVRNSTQANFLPWAVKMGWPERPYIQYVVDKLYWSSAPAIIIGTANVLNAGLTSSGYIDVASTSFVPPNSRMARIIQTSFGGNTIPQFRENGSTYEGFSGINGSGVSMYDIGLDGSRVFEYKRTLTGVGSSGVYVDIDGFWVTETT